MRAHLLIGAAVVVVVACQASKPAPSTPAPVVTTSPATRTSDVLVAVGRSDSFSPLRGDSALKAFVPDVAANETGGECGLIRTGGSGATVVTAYFPNRKTADMQVNITFDSAGRLVRYGERRGVVNLTGGGAPIKAEQLDSAIRATEAKMRSTTISLDYAVDQAMVMNRGGGRPTNAIMGTVRAVEKLEKLGPTTARLERVRKLCGV